MSDWIVEVAVPAPLRQNFDYLCDHELRRGMRVRVSFGRQNLVAIVISCRREPAVRKLKRIAAVLDAEPVIPAPYFTLFSWLADYYHHPVGETLTAALPVLCRQPAELREPAGSPWFRRTPATGNAEPLLNRSPAQLEVYQAIGATGWVSGADLSIVRKGWRQTATALQAKSLIESKLCFAAPDPGPEPPPIELTPKQEAAARKIKARLGAFRPFLLKGITGSGKTEVYMDVARRCIADGKQVLMLVPEISLTPQLVARVRAQLGQRVYPLHSAMTDRARYETWWLAREGLADVVLGTRSAVFTQLKNPGLIVVDEEHDLSYKQQDGLRYHARDFAIKRAQEEEIPVVLGSATPSMESLHNARAGRYDLLVLSERIGSARLPDIQSVDLEVHQPVNGLSAPVVDAIRRCLEKDQQIIVYINRRGYAPLVKCYQCDWQAACDHCNAALTFHRRTRQFRCHHCGYRRQSSARCPDCDADLFFAGAGTQRIEQALQGRFPQARVARLDRDEANTANKLYRQLDAIRDGEVDIVVGTQLITKGHDFAGVALVCVINADSGLFSADFRAPELMFQQLLQVAGRAGRAAADGQVLIQTQHADHPMIAMIKSHDYDAFAARCLAEREQAAYPPFGYFALFRAEDGDPDAPIRFLESVREVGESCRENPGGDYLDLLYPAPSPMEKLAGRYRAQLLVRSPERRPLHRLLDRWLPAIDEIKRPRSVRWSLDIDPMDMF